VILQKTANTMFDDRLLPRLLKLGILIGCAGLLVEGLFEFKKFTEPFLAPPSVPGQGKIIEHFLVQHVMFPVLGLSLVFRPTGLSHFVSAKLAAVFFAGLAIIVSVPELIVSSKDLFRAYPFNLHFEFLKAIQMGVIFGVEVNFLQLHHLVFAHFVLMGTIVWLGIHGQGLIVFLSGPRTSGVKVVSVPN
jgi:hypothetical protein